MKNNLAVTTDFANGGNILNNTDLVIDVHNGYHGGVVTQCSLELFQVQQAIRLRIHVGHFITLAFQLATAIQYRLVLGLECDDVLAVLLVEVCRALDREIIRFSCTRCPDNFFRVGINELRHIDSRLFDSRLGLPAEFV